MTSISTLALYWLYIGIADGMCNPRVETWPVLKMTASARAFDVAYALSHVYKTLLHTLLYTRVKCVPVDLHREGARDLGELA